jgi:hypothetical protein
MPPRIARCERSAEDEEDDDDDMELSRGHVVKEIFYWKGSWVVKHRTYPLKFHMTFVLLNSAIFFAIMFHMTSA